MPNPLSVYGKTKLAGEESLKTINPKNCIIIRTSWVYNKNGKNFFINFTKQNKISIHQFIFNHYKKNTENNPSS